MECLICFHGWDLQERRPKGLPCLHSVCLSCLGRLNERKCPQCRRAFTDPVPDNFALMECLEAMELENATRSRGPWWCTDCRSASSPRCMEEHAVLRPSAALRRGLQDLVPRASQDLQGLQDDGLQGLHDGPALAALRLLNGPPVACSVTLRQDGGQAVSAEWRVDGQAQRAGDSLLKALLVALAASGCLHQEEVREEPQPPGQERVEETANLPETPERIRQPEEEVQDEPVLLAAQDERIVEINFAFLRPEEMEETLESVRQRGVRRMELDCRQDRAWCLELLRRASPTLEELDVLDPLEEHLAVVHTMPRLRRLNLRSIFGTLDAHPPVLAPLPHPGRLTELRVWAVPRTTTQALLRAHATSLQVLWLLVGTARDKEWREGCSDLAAFLGQCGLRAITRLVLERRCPQLAAPDRACMGQIYALRRALPGCTVACGTCDGVKYEF